MADDITQVETIVEESADASTDLSVTSVTTLSDTTSSTSDEVTGTSTTSTSAASGSQTISTASTVYDNIILSTEGALKAGASKYNDTGIFLGRDGSTFKFSVVGASGSFSFDGSTVSINADLQSTNYSAGVSGWKIATTGTAEFYDVIVRGTIRACVFEKDVVSAVGGQLIVASADTIATDMTALDSSTLTIDGNVTFATNSILHLKNETDEEYMRVTNAASAPTYTVTRDLAAAYSADSNPAWKAGTAVVKEGVSDGASTYSGGWLRMIGDGTNSPRYSVFKRTSVAYNGSTEYIGLGNVNGLLDYVADDYGIVIGTSTDGYLAFEPTNGLRVTGDLSSQVRLTAGEALAIGDLVGISTTDTAIRFSPLSLPSTFASSALDIGSLDKGSDFVGGVGLKITSDLFFAIGNDATNGRVAGISAILSNGTAASSLDSSASLLAFDNPTSASLTKMDSTRVLVTACKANSFQAEAITASTITVGTPVTIDSTNVNDGFGEFISDSHVLFISQDTSSGNIQFHKYTASSLALTSSSSGTLSTVFAGDTYVIQGVRQFSDSAYFLIIVQNTTDATAYALIAHYDTGSSTFDSVGSPVTFTSISATRGNMAAMASLSSTNMLVFCPTSSTAGKYFLVTRSGTTPTVGTLNTATTRTAPGSYSMTAVNERCGYLVISNGSSGIVSTLLEIKADGTTLTERSTRTYTSTPNSSGTPDYNFPAFAWNSSPNYMGFICVRDSTDDPEVGVSVMSLTPAIGFAKAAASAAATVTAVTSGKMTGLSGLTVATKYYADIGGLVSSDSNGAPDTVGVSSSTTAMILKSW